MSRPARLHWTRIVRAYVARDIALTTSYRFDAFLQCVSIGILVALLYFVATLIRPEGPLGEFGGYFPFAVVGLACAGIVDAAYVSFIGALRGEQVSGTLEELLLSSARPFELLLGGAASQLLRAVATAILYVGAATAVQGWFLHGSILLALLVLALGVIASASLGVVSASFVMVFKKGDPLQFLMRGATLLLGGVLFPLSALPSPLQSLSRVLPVTWTLEAVRAILLRGAAARDVAGALVYLSIFIAVALPASLYCLRAALRRAMRDGSLSQS